MVVGDDPLRNWTCDFCSQENYVYFNDFTKGLQIYRVGQTFLADKQHDFAAIFFVTAIDSAICTGIVKATNLSYLRKGEQPPGEKLIEEDFRRLSLFGKLQKLEKLCGRKFSEIIDKYRDTFEGEIDNEEINFYSLSYYVKKLQIERNRFVHFGKDVDSDLVSKTSSWAGLTVYFVEQLVLEYLR